MKPYGVKKHRDETDKYLRHGQAYRTSTHRKRLKEGHRYARRIARLAIKNGGDDWVLFLPDAQRIWALSGEFSEMQVKDGDE